MNHAFKSFESMLDRADRLDRIGTLACRAVIAASSRSVVHASSRARTACSRATTISSDSSARNFGAMPV